MIIDSLEAHQVLISIPSGRNKPQSHKCLNSFLLFKESSLNSQLLPLVTTVPLLIRVNELFQCKIHGTYARHHKINFVIVIKTFFYKGQ